MRIGIPAKIPVGLLEAFKSFIHKTSGLEDIYFGLVSTNEELSYLAILEINDSSKSRCNEIAKDIGVMLNELKVDRPLDIGLSNDSYKEMMNSGGLISCKKGK